MPFPPLRGAPADRHVSIRLTTHEYRLLARLAHANSLTLSSLIAEAVAVFAGDLVEGAPLSCRARSCESCPWCGTTPAE